MSLAKLKYSSKGQSVAEFVVTMAALAPLLLALASFSNLLTLNTETVEAGRLAAWQRTVYKESDAHNFAAADIEERVRDSIEEVYLTKSFADYGPGRPDTGSTLPSIVDKSIQHPVSVDASSQVAVAGVGLVSSHTRLATELGTALKSQNEVMQSPRISIAINENYSLLQHFKYENYQKVSYDSPSLPSDEIAGRNQFNTSSHSALVAAGWMPGTSEDLQDVVSEAAFDNETLGVFEGGNVAFDLLGFEEAQLALDSYNTSAVDTQNILPSDL